MSRQPLRLLPVLAAAATLAACEAETRITKYHPFFANMPDARTGQPPVGGRDTAFTDPGAVPDDRTIIKNRDGSVTLVSKSVRQLMRHLERTLDDGKQDDLIFEQLIAEETKKYIRSEGTDPKEYVAYLHECRRDIGLFFARMPVGEHSPTVVFEPTGDKQYCVRLTGASANGVRFTKLWVALEKGTFKLLWLS